MTDKDALAKANRILAAVRETVDEHCSTRSMDNNWPEDWAEEIEAILDDNYCQECGSHPRRIWGNRLRHYTHCSKYKEEDWR